MRFNVAIFCLLLAPPVCTQAQVSVGIGLPGVNIGINLGAYPEMVQIPGYPVYYAPQAGSNLFFYDGVYWAYSQDNWYSSTWYNGPWDQISFEVVPPFLLRIPVGYYRQRPLYFREWREDAPPRWGERWGPDWARRHRDWDHWDRNEMPVLAPLPRYQRDYGGNRYPGDGQQRELRTRNYSYQPQGDIARQVYQRPAHPASPPAGEQNSRAGRDRGSDPRDGRSNTQRLPHVPPQQGGGEDRKRPAIKVPTVAAPVAPRTPPADALSASPRQGLLPHAAPERDVRVKRDLREPPAPVLRQAPPDNRRAPETQTRDRASRNVVPDRQDGLRARDRPSGKPDAPGGKRPNERDKQQNETGDRVSAPKQN